MKILIITGELAKEDIIKAVGDFADVFIVPFPVASLITPDMLIRHWKKSEFFGKIYDVGLISGFSKTDFSKAETVLGFPIMLGPKNSSDLTYISELSFSDFSKETPVCVHLAEIKKELAINDLIKFENEASFSFKINDIKIGKDSKMKVIYEIADVSQLSFEQLELKIKNGIDSGADIIDLGFSPADCPKNVSAIVKFSKSICSSFSIPLSCDTTDPVQIFESLLAGADVILSLTPGNFKEVNSLVSNTGNDFIISEKTFVLLPNLEILNKSYDYKIIVSSLLDFYKEAKALFPDSKFIFDPVLNPPLFGISDSICAYKKLQSLNKENIPVLFGTGNVTELIDADSIGINALLAAFGAEVGASVLFTPEASNKAEGSVFELKRASDMMFLAKNRNVFPKDLGIDLLRFKEKRKRIESVESIPYIKTNNTIAFSTEFKSKFIPDKGGNFYIHVVDVSDLKDIIPEDFCTQIKKQFAGHKKLILVAHSKKIFLGTDALNLLDNILKSGLVTLLSHAGYLGAEIKKAEIAISQNRSYMQDDIF